MQELLQRHMAHATTRDIGDRELAAAISRLATEASFLLSTGRHDWAKRRAAELRDSGNWPAYAMETHVTYAFESAGMHTVNGAKCLDGSATDVDLVWRHGNGVDIRVECVALREPEKFWTDVESVAPGIEVKTALHDGQGESQLLRVVQDKIRLKTISRDGTPIKFPEPDASSVNLIFADVSNAAGWEPDWWDLREIALGRDAALPCWKHNLVGLFENENPLGVELDEEFRRSRYVRERIHGIFYFVDESSFHHPLNPIYCGHCVLNPHLPMSEVQEEAADEILVPLNVLVTQGWLREPRLQR